MLANIVAILALFYWYVRRCHSYWPSRGVPGPQPTFLLGNMLDRSKKQVTDYELDYFRQFGHVYGIYTLLAPKLVIAKPELAKQVMIKDFGNFVNRRVMNSFHRIWSINLFHLSDAEKWRKIRTIVSPTFTSGKLKGMNAIMAGSIGKLDRYFEKLLKDKSSPVPINTKAVLQGFTLDVIASTTFATETDANNVEGKDSLFVKMAMTFFNVNPIKGAIITSMPRWVNNLLGMGHAFPEENFNFFYNLTKEILRTRRETGIKNNDLVQLLLNAGASSKATNDEQLTATMEQGKAYNVNKHSILKNVISLDDEEVAEEGPRNNAGGGLHLSEDEIIAQCMVFFVAG